MGEMNYMFTKLSIREIQLANLKTNYGYKASFWTA